MDRTFMFVGALMGFVGVGLGAFGAHALRGRLSPEMLAIFETAVRYQMYHAIALLCRSLRRRLGRWLRRRRPVLNHHIADDRDRTAFRREGLRAVGAFDDQLLSEQRHLVL